MRGLRGGGVLWYKPRLDTRSNTVDEWVTHSHTHVRACIYTHTLLFHACIAEIRYYNINSHYTFMDWLGNCAFVPYDLQYTVWYSVLYTIIACGNFWVFPTQVHKRLIRNASMYYWLYNRTSYFMYSTYRPETVNEFP